MADIATLGLKVDSSEVKGATSDLDNFSKSGDGASASIAKMAAEVVAAGAVIVGTIAAVRGAAEAANEYQNSLKGLASVARYAGEDIAATLGKSVKLTEDGLLATAEAATALKNLLAAGFTTDQAVEMITRFKDAAAFGRQGSLELGQAVVSATEGIKNQNSILVDNAGVTKNISVMQKEYAAELGKTVGQLTEAEKRQATYVGIMKETEAQVGNAALAASGLDGSNARLSKSAKDLAITFGNSVTPAVIGLTDALTLGFKTANEAIKPFLWLTEAVAISIGQLAMSSGAFFDFISSPKKWFDKTAQAEFKNQLATFARIAEEAKADVARRLDEGVTPNIGVDTGKRRQAASEAENPADVAKTAKERDRLRERYSALHDIAIAADATEEMRIGLKYEADIKRMDKEYEDAIASGVRKSEIDAAYHQAKLDRAHMAEADLAALREKANEREYQAELKRVNSLTGIARMTALIRRGEVSNALDTAVAMSAGLAQSSRTMFEINKAASIASVTVKGYKAAMDAYAEGGPILGPVLAAASVAFTAAQIAGINSTQFGGGGSAPSAPSTSGAAQYGGNAAPAPIIEPVQGGTNPKQPVQVNIYNQGNVLSNDFVMDTVIPQIKDVISNSDVLIIDPRSRQAAVLGVA